FIADLDAFAGTVHVQRGDDLYLTAAHNIPPHVVQIVAHVPHGKGMAGVAQVKKAPVQTCNLQTDASGTIKPGAKAVDAQAAEAAAKIGRGAVAHALDTADARSIDAIGRFVEAEIGRLDILVNNAGILLDEGKSIADVEAREFEETWRVNTLGPFLLTKRFAPLLRKSGHGRVVNVSSGAGQLSSMSGYAPSYS